MRKRKHTKENSEMKCMECRNFCCRYITVRVSSPRSMHDFDFLLWQLYHENVKVFKDYTGWYLLIYNPCLHLEGNGNCSIYENRPIVCRYHSNNICEFDLSISESSTLFFDNYKSFDEFCRKRFKTWEKRYRNI